MNSFFKQVLELDEVKLSFGLKQLERSTGNSAIDVRLIADVTARAHHVMRELGLDTKDSHAKEVYQALKAFAKGSDLDKLLSNTDYTMILIQDHVVSFNLIDIIESHHHELPYEKRSLAHGRRSLRGELVNRYMSHTRSDETSIKSLAYDVGLLDKDN